MADEKLIRPGLCSNNPKDIPKIKEELRNKITRLSFRDIRRKREPLYSCIVQELEEDKFFETANFFKLLFRREQQIHLEKLGLKTKKLDTEPKLLDQLVKVLQKSETCKEAVNYPTDNVTPLIEIAEVMSKFCLEFDWVNEDILLEALRRNPSDNKRSQATVLFFLGKYYTKVKKPTQAAEIFESTIHLTAKKRWTVSQAEPVSLYRTVCSEYAKVLVKLSYESFEKDPNKSITIIKKALDLARKSEKHQVIGFILDNYGDLLLKMNQGEDAYFIFEESLTNYKIDGNPRNMVTSGLHIANCLIAIVQWEDAAMHIDRVIAVSQKHSFLEELADAHVLKGHIDRKTGQTTSASENYIKAVELFNQVGLENHVRYARCWAAVSLAQNIIGPYCETIYKSDTADEGDNEFRQKLLAWADNRVPFWTEPSQISSATLRDKQSVNMSKIASYLSASKESLTTSAFRDYRERQLSKQM